MLHLTITCEPGKKSWVCQILGRGQEYYFDRCFLDAVSRPKKGEAGSSEYILDEGLYEICELNQRRYMLLGKEDAVEEIDRERAVREMLSLEKKRKAKASAEKRKKDRMLREEIKKLAKKDYEYQKEQQAREQALNDELAKRIAKINGEGGFSLN
jgi:hypothetical protein